MKTHLQTIGAIIFLFLFGCVVYTYKEIFQEILKWIFTLAFCALIYWMIYSVVRKTFKTKS